MSTPRRLPLLLALSLTAQGAQVVSALLVARLALNGLELKDAAFWYLLAGLIPFIVIFDFGIGQTAAREVAFARTRDEIGTEIEDIARTVLVLLGSSTLVVGMLGVLVVSAGWAMGWIGLDRLSCIAIFGIGTLIKVLANGTQGLLIGLERIGSERLVRAAGSLLFCLGAWTFLEQGWGVVGLSLAWLVQALFCLVVSSAAIAHSGVYVVRGHFRWGIAKRMREPLVQYFLSAVPGLFIFNLALYLVASVLDAKAIVVLSLTMQILSGMALIAALPPGTLTASWSSLWARMQLDQLRMSVRFGLLLVSLALSAVVAVVGVHTELVSSIVFGKEALAAGAFMLLYLAIGFIEGLANCLTAAALSTGFVRFASVTWASAALVSLLTWSLTHVLGLLGVPLAVLVAQLFTCWQRNLRVAFKRLELGVHEVSWYALIVVVPLTLQIVAQIVLAQILESARWDRLSLLIAYLSASAVLAAGLLIVWRSRDFQARSVICIR